MLPVKATRTGQNSFFPFLPVFLPNSFSHFLKSSSFVACERTPFVWASIHASTTYNKNFSTWHMWKTFIVWIHQPNVQTLIGKSKMFCPHSHFSPFLPIIISSPYSGKLLLRQCIQYLLTVLVEFTSLKLSSSMGVTSSVPRILLKGKSKTRNNCSSASFTVCKDVWTNLAAVLTKGESSL